MTCLQSVSYPIVEIFHSVQGEGAWTGVNAYFIRLGGCDVYCSWCDQKETWNASRHPQMNVIEIVTEAKNINCAIVVITGGEPLIYNLYPLTTELKKSGMRVHLETSGTHPFSGDFDWVTFSPKTYKKPHESIYQHADEIKVVIAHEKDIKWAEDEGKKLLPHTLKYLQPEWNSPSSQDLIFNYILKNPEWRISLQTHKLMQIR
jgi:organic radical activating enzyme